ncbi:MAG: 16S rRNA (guanine(527)-N(7))-methyltransferase RsmG [Pseudonocardiaceae bacterium]
MNPAEPEVVPDAARRVFGDTLAAATAFVELLRVHGAERGLIGPRELDRLWDRHVLNSAVLAELVPVGARVVDIGSGGGFPGIPLAIARPDLHVTLVEPMARRVDWLNEVVQTLGLPNTAIVRGRAEERAVRDMVDGADVVTARAVAPLAKLAAWCLPLARPGGVLLALKGMSAQDEVDRDRDALRRLGGGEVRVAYVGAGVLSEPTTVVSVTKTQATKSGSQKKKRIRR